MRWYCEKCKDFHEDGELCPHIRKQISDKPVLLSHAATFTNIVGQYSLITSNALNHIAEAVNGLVGTNFAYEGTHQITRDIQVFRRLAEEPFSVSGVFNSPQTAKAYLEVVKAASEETPRAMTSFISKLTGYGQEADWLRYKSGLLSSLYEKSELLGGNAAGIDGITINRFTGKTISRTTVKASINPLTKNSTAITDVKEALETGTAQQSDVLFAPKGAKNAAKAAGLHNPVVEKNSSSSIQESNKRLISKIENEQAYTYVTGDQIVRSVANGAIIGAAVGLTVSSVTAFIRWNNGEITEKEALRDVSEDTVKSAISGGVMGGVTLFLPGGPIGFIAGVGIGIYVNSVLTNILDEIWGKGAFGAILSLSGYVAGTALNLRDAIEAVANDQRHIQNNYSAMCKTKHQAEEVREEFESTISRIRRRNHQ